MTVRSALVAVLLVLGACAPAAPATADGGGEVTVVYLVRHAEKAAAPADDPPLTPEGAARAQALAALLADAGVDAVYSSQFERTRATAAPLAARLGLEVVVLPIEGPDVAPLLRDQALRVARENAGGAALVAGHSNTVTVMIGALTGEPMAPLDESEYGDLFVVTLAADGSAALARRRFGDG